MIAIIMLLFILQLLCTNFWYAPVLATMVKNLPVQLIDCSKYWRGIKIQDRFLPSFY